MDDRVILVSKIEQRIAELDRQLQSVERLKIERETLRRLLDDGGNGSPSPVRLSTNLPGPTEAVKAVVRESGPLSPREIVAQASRRVDSRAEDVRRTLYSTVTNLKKRKVLLDAGNGLLTIRNGVG